MSTLTYATQSSYNTKFLTTKYINTDNHTVNNTKHTLNDIKQYICQYVTHYTIQQQYIISELLYYILSQSCTLTNNINNTKLNTLHNILIQHILHIVHIAPNNTDLIELQAQIIQHYDNLIIQHSVERPPYSIAIFSLSDLQHIATFYDKTVTPHIASLIYAFEPIQQIDVTGIQADIAAKQLQQAAVAEAEAQNTKNKVKPATKATVTAKT